RAANLEQAGSGPFFQNDLVVAVSPKDRQLQLAAAGPHWLDALVGQQRPVKIEDCALAVERGCHGAVSALDFQRVEATRAAIEETVEPTGRSDDESVVDV